MYWPARAVATVVVAALILGVVALVPVIGGAREAATGEPSGVAWGASGAAFSVADSGTNLVSAQPDIVATPLGFVVGHGPIAWGHTVKIDDPDLVKATRSGPDRDLCLLAPTGFRTFNKGPVSTGDFKATVYRGDVLVHSEELSLAPDSGDTFQPFDLPVHKGLNVIHVILDSARQVSESDEGNNSFTIKIDMALDCAAPQPAP
jgi:hypothetical protein